MNQKSNRIFFSTSRDLRRRWGKVLAVKKIRSVAEFNEARKQPLLLVHFGAPWCAPCRLQEPIMRRLASHFKGRACVAGVNIDQVPEAASRWGISSIPTLLVFRKGKEIQRFAGLQPAEILSGILEESLRAGGTPCGGGMEIA